MAKPAFDESKPYQAIDKPEFDASKPYEAAEPGLLSKAASAVGKGISTAGEYEQRYGGSTAVGAGLNELTKPPFFGAQAPSFGQRLSGAYNAMTSSYAKPTSEVPARMGENLGFSTERPKPVDMSWDKLQLGQPNPIAEKSPAEKVDFLQTLAQDPVNVLGFGLGKMFQGAKTVAQPLARAAMGIEEAPNAGKVLAASKELGLEPTAAQLTDSKYIGRQEDLLKKGDAMVGGSDLRAQVRSNDLKLQEHANNLVSDAGIQTKNEAGIEFAKTFQNEVDKKIANAESIYGAWEDALKQTGLPASTANISKDINSLAEEFKFSKPVKSEIDSAKADIASLKSIDDIKAYRTQVGRNLETAKAAQNSDLVSFYSKLYGSLSEARSDSLKALAQQTQTGDFANQALAQLSQADQEYASASRQVKDALGEESKAGPRAQTKGFFKENSVEAASNKILDLKDPTKVQTFAENFPDSFNILRERKIREIEEASQVGGKLDTAKLAKNIQKLPEESRNLVFGDGASEKVDAIKQFIDTMPPPVNPSGSGLQLSGIWNLWNLKAQAGSLTREAAYNFLTKAPESPSFFNKTQALIAIPKIQNYNAGIPLPGRSSVPLPRRND